MHASTSVWPKVFSDGHVLTSFCIKASLMFSLVTGGNLFSWSLYNFEIPCPVVVDSGKFQTNKVLSNFSSLWFSILKIFYFLYISLKISVTDPLQESSVLLRTKIPQYRLQLFLYLEGEDIFLFFISPVAPPSISIKLPRGQSNMRLSFAWSENLHISTSEVINSTWRKTLTDDTCHTFIIGKQINSGQIRL